MCKANSYVIEKSIMLPHCAYVIFQYGEYIIEAYRAKQCSYTVLPK